MTDIMDRAMQRFQHECLEAWSVRLFTNRLAPLFGPRKGALLGERGDFTTLLCENRLIDDGLIKAKAIEHSRAIQEVLAFATSKGVGLDELASGCENG